MKKKNILILLTLLVLLCGCSARNSIQKKLNMQSCFVDKKTELFQVPNIEWGMKFDKILDKMGIAGYEKNYVRTLMNDSKNVPSNIGDAAQADCYYFDGDRVHVIFEIYNKRCYHIEFSRNGYDYPDVQNSFSVLKTWHNKLINEYGTENYHTNFDNYSTVEDLHTGDKIYAVWTRSNGGKNSILCLYAYISKDKGTDSTLLNIDLILTGDIDGVSALDLLKKDYSFLQDVDLYGESKK